MVQVQRPGVSRPASVSSPNHSRFRISPKTTSLAIAVAAGVGVFAVIIFWPAGRLDWTAGWLYVDAVRLTRPLSAIPGGLVTR